MSQAATLSHAEPILPQRRAVNARSVTLGMLGVCFICGLTPFNNYVLNNTDMVGNFMPLGLLLFFLSFILLINAPLRRWAPRVALSSGEMSVALCMTLVGCALPSVGLMRYLPGHLAAFFAHASVRPEYRQLMETLDLPDWMFPTFADKDPGLRGNDPIVAYFYSRVPIVSDRFIDRLWAVPWAAWRTPALTWGIFVACLFGAVLCLSLVFRRQWVENERLPFPLASIYLSLIEQPEPGRALNRLFRARAFWIAFAVVFAIHAINAMAVYDRKHWPGIPMHYNLDGVMTNEPLRYAEWDFKYQRVFFTVIGITFFVQSNVALSLWFFFVAVQAARMILGSRQSEINYGMEVDQIFGALIPMGITIVWVARHHLATVIRQMFRRPVVNEPQGRYVPYRLAGWGLLLCLGGLIGWLMAGGASLIGASVLALMLMTMYLVLAKTVAETGLLYVLIPTPLNRPWIFVGNELPAALTARTTLPSFFFASMFSGVLTHDLREALPVYSTHALRIADATVNPQRQHWRGTLSLVMCLILALAVAYVVAGAGTLYCHYSYASTLDRLQDSPIGAWGSRNMAEQIALAWTRDYVPPKAGGIENHNRVGNFAFGAGLTTLLSVLRLRYVNWPLHPVGYLLCYTWGIRQIWFSILLGWLAKVLVLRLGGGGLFRRAREFFIGLILGEAAAASFWLCVSIVRQSLGLDYYAIRLLPF